MSVDDRYLWQGRRRRIPQARRNRCARAFTWSLGWALLMCPLGAHAQSDEPLNRGQLEIRAPSRLVLGRDTKAAVSFSRPDRGPIAVHTNVGSVSAPKPTRDGRMKVTYRPPTSRFPQVAIIAVSAGGTVVDWTLLPLYGVLPVVAEAEPRARVSLRVGNANYGPKRASSRGQARFAGVEVAPGVPTALTAAVDPHGNRSSKTVQLNPPPFGRILAVCSGPRQRVELIAVDPRRLQPDRSAHFKLEAKPGELVEVQSAGEGFYRARYTVRGGLELGEVAEIQALPRDEPDPASRCRIPIAKTLPDGIAAVLGATRFVAGEAPIRVSVELRYPAAGVPRWVPVSASTDVGTLSKLRRVSDTRFEAFWSLPSKLPAAKATLQVRADTGHGPPLQAEQTLALSAAAVSRLQIAMGDRTLVADGKQSSTVSVRPLDAFGNLVPEVRLRASSAGELSEFKRQPDGSLRARYTAPYSYSDRTDEISVYTLGASDARADTALELAHGPRYMVLDLRAGFLTNLGLVSAPMLRGALGLRLSPISRGLVLSVESGWYASSTSKAPSTDAEPGAGEAAPPNVRVAVTAVPVLARLSYELRAGPSLWLYAGAGAGALFGVTEVQSPEIGLHRYGRARLAASAILGAGLAAGPGRASLELGYLRAQIQAGNDPQQSAVRGNLGGLSASAGYGIEF